MKKSIIAIAVSSAALASVSVQAAEGSTVDVYGNIQYAYSYTDESGEGGNFEDNGSTIGLKGETKINDDLTAFFKYELEFNADQKENRDNADGYNESKLDQAYVGLKGNFGKVQIGSFDTIYKDAIQDNLDGFEYLGFEGGDRTSEGDTIAYFSPSINGFEVQTAIQVKGESSEGGASNDNYDSLSSMVVLKYSADMFSVALGYDSRNNTADAEATTGLAVTVMPMDNLSVTAKLETTEDTKDIMGLTTRYGYGYGDLYASYQNIDPDNADDYNEYGVGATYNLASNVYVFAEIGQQDSTEDSVSAVGVYYGF